MEKFSLGGGLTQDCQLILEKSVFFLAIFRNELIISKLDTQLAFNWIAFWPSSSIFAQDRLSEKYSSSKSSRFSSIVSNRQDNR